jgi:hypothetical protein
LSDEELICIKRSGTRLGEIMEGQGKVKVHGGSFQLVMLTPQSYPDQHDGLWTTQERAGYRLNQGMDRDEKHTSVFSSRKQDSQ